MSLTFDATILGGLPVEVDADIYGAEPDVGIFHNWAEIGEIRYPSRRRKRDGKLIRGAPLSPRVLARLTDRDYELLSEAALDNRSY